MSAYRGYRQSLQHSVAVLLVTLPLLGLAACGRSSKPSGEQVRALQRKVEAKEMPAYVARGEEGARLWTITKSFYQARGHQPAWIGRQVARPQLNGLIAALEKADRAGLNPVAYDLPQILMRKDELARATGKIQSDPVKLIEMDLWLTYTFLKYSSHLLAGRVDSKAVNENWIAKPRKMELAKLLETSLAENRVEEIPERLAPRSPHYEALQQALTRYRELAAAGGWATIPETKGSRKGTQNPYVHLIRKNLALVGDLENYAPKAEEHQSAFDESLEQAVRKFEARHGLKVDGMIDPEFVAALNVPPEQRVQQIELNLERLRWLPEDPGNHHLSVNIPSFELAAVEDGKTTLTMRVIVGKKENPTPIFSDRLTHVVFSPYWNIPDSIALKETIPEILKDPGYLDRQQIEVIRGAQGQPVDPATIDWELAATDPSYKLRQKPGPANSLGHVKFLFPNQFDVYMHDTPADSLFQRIERGFSHGCIRVERPMDLAQHVLRDQPEWTAEKIQAAMHAGVERHVALKTFIPVHLQYSTAWVNPDGSVQFREDIYGHDERHARLLARNSKPRQAAKEGG